MANLQLACCHIIVDLQNQYSFWGNLEPIPLNSLGLSKGHPKLIDTFLKFFGNRQSSFFKDTYHFFVLR